MAPCFAEGEFVRLEVVTGVAEQSSRWVIPDVSGEYSALVFKDQEVQERGRLA